MTTPWWPAWGPDRPSYVLAAATHQPPARFFRAPTSLESQHKATTIEATHVTTLNPNPTPENPQPYTINLLESDWKGTNLEASNVVILKHAHELAIDHNLVRFFFILILRARRTTLDHLFAHRQPTTPDAPASLELPQEQTPRESAATDTACLA